MAARRGEAGREFLCRMILCVVMLSGHLESSWLTTDGFFVRRVRCVRQWAARMVSMEPENKKSYLLVVACHAKGLGAWGLVTDLGRDGEMGSSATPNRGAGRQGP